MGLSFKFNIATSTLGAHGFLMPAAWQTNAAMAVLLAVSVLLLPTRFRNAGFVALALAGGLLALIDAGYARFFDTAPSAVALRYGAQILGVHRSFTAMFGWRDLLFLVDLPLVVLLARGPLPGWRRSGLGIAALAAVLVGTSLAGLERRVPGVLTTGWNPRFVAVNVGEMAFHAMDLLTIAQSALAAHVTDEEVAAIARFLQRQQPAHGMGLAPGANLIVIQVEALQQFALDARVPGGPVTPVLDAWRKACLAYTNVYTQIGEGHTADAEFMTNTGMYPLNHGVAFVSYAHNRYDGLPRRLTSLGYRSVAYHADDAGFWNRGAMYQALGFTDFLALESYSGEVVGLGPNDGDFFRQTLPRLEALPRPFHAQLVTLSSHHPYDDPHFASFDVGPYAGTNLGRYMQAIHYADAQLGILLAGLKRDGLLDSSVVVLYGDHPGLDRADLPALARLTGTRAAGRLAWLEHQKIPVLIHLPHDRLAGTYTAPYGQVDLMPTMAHLVGADTRGAFGHDMLGRDPGPVVLHDGSVVQGDVCIDAIERRAVRRDDGVVVFGYPAAAALEDAARRRRYADLIVRDDLLARLQVAWENAQLAAGQAR